MRVRIIYGKLRPGTWDAYEAAYKEVAEQSGQIPGLRARWLNRGSNKCLMGPTISTAASGSTELKWFEPGYKARFG